MDKDGKLFGKISIIDILAIVLVVVVIGGTYYKFNSPKASIDTAQKNINYTVLIKGVRDFTVDYYETELPCYDNKTKEYIGKIKNIEITPYAEKSVLLDGSTVYAEKPNALNIYLDIEAPGQEAANAYYANGTYEIKAGSEINLSTKYVEVYCTVTDVFAE